eukprot:GHVU01140924.1.p1 GENE.GHVU01140924.1~~GHVU01140924.1.p1  ORF type:complete len:620 (-),score=70.26 GHVU01140924.1:558-2372(-)
MAESSNADVAIGQRVCAEIDEDFIASPGTVRYIGPLEGDPNNSTWVGIEWDDKERGKHDGSYNGTRYFSCVDGGSGSFIKFSKLQEKKELRGIDMAKAVIMRYHSIITPEEEANMVIIDSKTKRTKKVEFVGKKEAEAYFKDITQLKALTLAHSGIKCGGDLTSLNLSSAHDVNLEGNLIVEWDAVFDLIRQLPALSSLNLSGNKIEVPSALKESDSCDASSKRDVDDQGFSRISVLKLNRVRLPWNTIAWLDSIFPGLEELQLCGNGYSGIPDTVFSKDTFVELKKLSLNENQLCQWEDLARPLRLPKIEVLCLNENAFGTVPVAWEALKATPVPEDGGGMAEVSTADDDGAPTTAGCDNEGDKGPVLLLPDFPTAPDTFVEIALEENQISDWRTFGCLCRSFPDVCVFRWQDNPLYWGYEVQAPAGKSSRAMQLSRQIAIAMLSRVQILNGSPVSKIERISAERYYLSLYQQHHPSVIGMGPSDVVLSYLQKKHGEVVCAATVGDTATHSIVDYLLSVKVEPDFSTAYGEDTVTKRLSCNMKIKDVKALCGKLFKLPSSRVRLLFHDNAAMPIASVIDDDFQDLAYYGIQSGYSLRVQDANE